MTVGGNGLVKTNLVIRPIFHAALVIRQRAVTVECVERLRARKLAQGAHHHFVAIRQNGGNVTQCLTILGNYAQIRAFAFGLGGRFFQLQFLLAAKFKSVGEVIFAGFAVAERQLPLIARRIKTKIIDFACLPGAI